MGTAGDGWTEPLYNYIEFCLRDHKKHRISKEIRCFSNFLSKNEETKNPVGLAVGLVP
jgi:hypothetical protein